MEPNLNPHNEELLVVELREGNNHKDLFSINLKTFGTMLARRYGGGAQHPHHLQSVMNPEYYNDISAGASNPNFTGYTSTGECDRRSNKGPGCTRSKNYPLQGDRDTTYEPGGVADVLTKLMMKN